MLYVKENTRDSAREYLHGKGMLGGCSDSDVTTFKGPATNSCAARARNSPGFSRVTLYTLARTRDENGGKFKSFNEVQHPGRCAARPAYAGVSVPRERRIIFFITARRNECRFMKTSCARAQTGYYQQ